MPDENSTNELVHLLGPAFRAVGHRLNNLALVVAGQVELAGSATQGKEAQHLREIRKAARELRRLGDVLSFLHEVDAQDSKLVTADTFLREQRPLLNDALTPGSSLNVHGESGIAVVCRRMELALVAILDLLEVLQRRCGPGRLDLHIEDSDDGVCLRLYGQASVAGEPPNGFATATAKTPLADLAAPLAGIRIEAAPMGGGFSLTIPSSSNL
ncbi:MAG TPA: hypothetical protein ENK43_01205 [Planctomycetes bacterium]|nr:hypothetical protein [Planctomycetota bacterium]